MLRCLFLYCIAIGAWAQTSSGRISGMITDSSGARVPGAAITVTNQATALKWNTATNSNGYFVITNLPVGVYNVEVEGSGFRKAEKTGYDLVDDGSITADFKLEIGAVTESANVIEVLG